MTPTPFRAWDDYFIPGTTVLRNKFTSPEQPYGVTDAELLRSMEEVVTAIRFVELTARPIPGDFDYDHMKAVHRHIFQDVYEWAGEERTAPDGAMYKEGHRYFGAGPALTERADELYAQLAEKNYLRELPRDRFIPELADIWGELNVVHSFREGNTRSQFGFFQQLCDHAGYTLRTDLYKLDGPLRDPFVQARYIHQDTTRTAPLADVLSKGLEDKPRGRRPVKDQISDLANRLQNDQPPSPGQIQQDRTRYRPR